MKLLIAGMLLLSAPTFAETLKVKVQNFNFNYTNPHGEGSAAFFSRNQLMGDEVYVSVDKIEKDFKLVVTGTEHQEFELKNAPSLMTDAETMSVNGFNLDLGDAASVSLASGRFNSSKDSLGIDGLNLNCARNLSQPELMDQMLTGCMQSMNFKTSKFSQSGNKVLGHALTMALTGEKSDLKINSVDLKTANGKFDLSAEVKAQVSGKVKSNGNMSYDPATATMTIKISEVKFGILNITSKVFDELKKNESEKLKVKQPYVYYKLK